MSYQKIKDMPICPYPIAQHPQNFVCLGCGAQCTLQLSKESNRAPKKCIYPRNKEAPHGADWQKVI